MDYDLIIKSFEKYFITLSEEYNSILKKYKNKCNMNIADSRMNNRIQDRLINIVENKMLELKKEINKLVTAYYGSIYKYIDYVKINNDENGLLPLMEELKKDKLSRKVYDRLHEISYELNRNLRNCLMHLGANEKTLEEFNYQFKSMSRTNIERIFDSSNIVSLNSDVVKMLEEIIMSKSKSSVSREDLENEWHK